MGKRCASRVGRALPTQWASNPDGGRFAKVDLDSFDVTTVKQPVALSAEDREPSWFMFCGRKFHEIARFVLGFDVDLLSAVFTVDGLHNPIM